MLIPLYDGQEAVVDEIDADLAEFVWFANGNGYAIRGGDHEPRLQRMHRIIMERMMGRSLGRHEFPDHINNQRLDNRRSNLRLATNAQNAFNRGRNTNNSSGYKGVYRNPGSSKNPWMARIMVNRRSHYLGSFVTAEAAARAYDAMAVRIAGQFAKTNGV